MVPVLINKARELILLSVSRVVCRYVDIPAGTRYLVSRLQNEYAGSVQVGYR
jgi:hypothetical protein